MTQTPATEDNGKNIRLNKAIARATGISRRAADEAISRKRVTINGQKAKIGQLVSAQDQINLDGKPIPAHQKPTTIMLNKPVGYVCSRNGQGSKTVYDLLPKELRRLKSVGRLDKESSGLLLLTTDGELAQKLTHPSYRKVKVYEITLDKPLAGNDKSKIEQGIMLEDGVSKLKVGRRKQSAGSKINLNSKKAAPSYEVRLAEGRNRQIRRTFTALGYKTKRLHRICFGPHNLNELKSGQFRFIK